jgi:hypothetical protein
MFGTWGYTTSMSGTISGQQMSGGGLGFETGGIPPTPYSCCACSAAFNGAFFGAGASHAGLAYQFSGATAKVSGVAVFNQ